MQPLDAMMPVVICEPAIDFLEATLDFRVDDLDFGDPVWLGFQLKEKRTSEHENIQPRAIIRVFFLTKIKLPQVGPAQFLPHSFRQGPDGLFNFHKAPFAATTVPFKKFRRSAETHNTDDFQKFLEHISVGTPFGSCCENVVAAPAALYWVVEWHTDPELAAEDRPLSIKFQQAFIKVIVFIKHISWFGVDVMLFKWRNAEGRCLC